MRSPNRQISGLLLLSVLLEYLVLFWMCVSVRKVLADNFFPSAIVESSKFYTTFSLGYSLPTVSGEIDFQLDKVSGRTGNELALLTFRSITENSPMYTRVVTGKDNLVLPPLSVVSMGVYMYNDTAHTVGVGNSWLFLGQYDGRPITDILELPGAVYRNVVYATGTALLTKGGQSVQFGSFGNIAANQDGVGGFYSKTRILGKVINPIRYNLKSAECIVGKNGIYGSQVVLNLLNEGKVEEKVSIVGGDSLILAPNEMKEDYTFFTAGNVSSIKLSVQNEVTRCLQRGAGSPHYGIPDSHSLVLSRNDENHYLWYGTALSMPSLGTDEQFCITRMPYVINMPIPICIEPSRYKPSMMSPDLNVESEEVKKISVKIQNIGGNDLLNNGVTAKITFPEVWAPYIEYEREGSLIRITGEELLLEGLLIKNLPKEGIESGHFIIKGPTFLSQEQARPFVLEIEIDGEKSNLTLLPKSIFKVSLISSEKLCQESQSSIQMNILLEGNVNNTELRLWINSLSEDDLEKKVKISWGEQEIEYPYTSNENTIVTLVGSFTPGTLAVSISANNPMGGELSIGVANMNDTAITFRQCPVVGVSPAVSVSPVVSVSPAVSVPPVVSVSPVVSPLPTPVVTITTSGKRVGVLGVKNISSTRKPVSSRVNTPVKHETVGVNLLPVIAKEVETEKTKVNYIFIVVPLIALIIVILLFSKGLPRKSGSR